MRDSYLKRCSLNHMYGLTNYSFCQHSVKFQSTTKSQSASMSALTVADDKDKSIRPSDPSNMLFSVVSNSASWTSLGYSRGAGYLSIDWLDRFIVSRGKREIRVDGIWAICTQPHDLCVVACLANTELMIHRGKVIFDKSLSVRLASYCFYVFIYFSLEHNYLTHGPSVSFCNSHSQVSYAIVGISTSKLL